MFGNISRKDIWAIIFPLLSSSSSSLLVSSLRKRKIFFCCCSSLFEVAAIDIDVVLGGDVIDGGDVDESLKSILEKLIGDESSSVSIPPLK
uniref:Uncharacterized protein n=1 Tax=Romanomermis culicivorax TaxID=13658 RepID=A0A915HX42_ROMCU